MSKPRSCPMKRLARLMSELDVTRMTQIWPWWIRSKSPGLCLSHHGQGQLMLFMSQVTRFMSKSCLSKGCPSYSNQSQSLKDYHAGHDRVTKTVSESQTITSARTRLSHWGRLPRSSPSHPPKNSPKSCLNHQDYVQIAFVVMSRPGEVTKSCLSFWGQVQVTQIVSKSPISCLRKSKIMSKSASPTHILIPEVMSESHRSGLSWTYFRQLEQHLWKPAKKKKNRERNSSSERDSSREFRYTLRCVSQGLFHLAWVSVFVCWADSCCKNTWSRKKIKGITWKQSDEHNSGGLCAEQ